MITMERYGQICELVAEYKQKYPALNYADFMKLDKNGNVLPVYRKPGLQDMVNGFFRKYNVSVREALEWALTKEHNRDYWRPNRK